MERYYNWLLSFIDEYHQKHYTNLLRKLFMTEFEWIIPDDENRAVDGVSMRQEFTAQTGIVMILPDTCSVLEMLIALARRINDITYEVERGPFTYYWFWTMIRNLGIAEMDDIHYDEGMVTIVLHDWMNRLYSPNGRGSLFYIPGCESDVRSVDIWCASNWYLTTLKGENYDGTGTFQSRSCHRTQ